MRKAVAHLRKSDPVLRRIIDKVGPYRIEYLEPTFDSLVQSIIYQQLSGKVAGTIYQRFVDALPDKRPSPESILRLRIPKLRACGLSRQKIDYIRDLAGRARRGEIRFEALPSLPDPEVMRCLTAVKGIGPWTVHMFLIFALRRPNVLPTGDLGIRMAVQRAYGLAELPRPAEIEHLAQRWIPYCTVASWYLWRSLEDKAGL